MTTKLLANQLQGILQDPVEGFTVELASDSSVYEWKVYIEGPKETCYSSTNAFLSEGGVFQLSLNFPKDYPMNPPVLKFISDFWHPNVYVDGKVCMSILHPPGDDAMSGELARERWLPTQSVTTIVLSLLSLLNDPNCSSPANVDASVEWRKNRPAYIQKCKKLVERANREKPAHVVIPHPDTDENEHKRMVQKWKEMNSGMDAEDFYEHNESESDNEEVESDEENEDEDDLVESDSEMDSEGEGEKKKEKGDKGKTKEIKESDAPATSTVSTSSAPPSPSPSQIIVPSTSTTTSDPVPPSLTPTPSSTTPTTTTTTPVSLPPPASASSSSSTNPPAPSLIPSQPPISISAEIVVEERNNEISAEIPVPSNSGPTSSGPNSNGPNSSTNNNNNASPPVSPRSGKKDKKKGGKKKKCIIM